MVGSSNGDLGSGNGGPGPDNAAHLLVADDDDRVRDLTSRFLQREGYRVTTATDAGDARAKLDRLSFDLLILDVTMPGESGFDLANFVRETSQVSDPDAHRACGDGGPDQRPRLHGEAVRPE
jgi:CheY-like chemotaxis protein